MITNHNYRNTLQYSMTSSTIVERSSSRLLLRGATTGLRCDIYFAYQKIYDGLSYLEINTMSTLVSANTHRNTQRSSMALSINLGAPRGLNEAVGERSHGRRPCSSNVFFV